MTEPLSSLSGAARSYDIVRLESTLSQKDQSRNQGFGSRAAEGGIEVLLPYLAMDLKIATAQFGMYLSFDERGRLFSELDYLLEADGWNPEDATPSIQSYTNFLKWLVESKLLNWASLGFDAAGNLLCAFVTSRGTVTAAFLPAPIVHWTSALHSEDGDEISAGHSPLRVFVGTARRLVEQLDVAD